MGRLRHTILVGILLAVLCGCFGCSTEQEHQKWDCSVVCADSSDDDTYVTTMSDKELESETGCLTFQNQNDFLIEIHLMNGDKEEVLAVEPGMCMTYTQAARGAVYTVGIHADVAEGEEIKLMVYDGEWSEPY